MTRAREAVRETLPLLSLLAVLMVTAVGFYTAQAPRSRNTVELPIRVYPENGTDEHVESVTLRVSDVSGVDRLYVRAHQPFYHRGGVEKGVEDGFDNEGAASIRVNGGSWVEVRDENVTCAWPEKGYQCVAGGFSTIRFSLPAINVVEGANTVEFKFNGTDGIRSGYRVLAVGFMRQGDDLQTFDPLKEGAHDPAALRFEDFSSWSAPEGYGNAADISAGERLWHEKALLIENRLSEEPIKAACASCHARDGRDLKYFNYSNRAIEARSRFHGLSEKEGKQIAAYIRSIELKKKNGQVYQAPGTPWDPPYQPGPELMATGKHPDRSDQVYWAAGAGLEWVLDRDEEMLPYLFPKNGDPSQGVDRLPSGELNWHRISMDSDLNMRAMPIAIQLPDWNNWLPDIHPMDGVPGKFEGGATQTRYEGALQAALSSGDLREIERQVKRLHRDFRRDDGLKAFDKPANLTPNEWALASQSTAQWLAVKVWESFHGHHLEDVADDMYGDDPRKPFHEPRAWMGRARTVFQVAPHLTGHNGTKHEPWVYANMAQDHFESHKWYQLQVILNPGSDPKSSGQTPVDWSYQRGYLRAGAFLMNVGAGLRMVQSEIKKWQRQSNGYGVDGTGGNGYDLAGFRRGWHPFHSTPHELMEMYDFGGGKGLPKNERLYQNLSRRLRSDVLTAVLRAWNDYNSRYPIAEFPRGMGKKRYNPPTSTQKMGVHTLNKDFATELYQVIPKVRANLDVAPDILNTLAAWGSKMWPRTRNPSWKELAGGDPSGNKAPGGRITNLSDGNTFIAPVDLTVEVDAYDPDGTVRKVELLAGGTSLDEDREAPYRFTWGDAPAGEHALEVRVTDDQGTSSLSAPVTIVVEEGYSTGDRSTQHIPLKKGWNLISSRVAPEDPRLETVFAKILSNVAVIKDEAGSSFVPAQGTNAIGEWNPREAYRVYAESSDTLSIAGTVLPAGLVVPLEAGWNQVPYLGSEPMPASDFFAPIASKLVIAKDYAGRVYAPPYGADDLGEVRPGQGYRVYVSEGTQLTSPEARRSAQRLSSR